MTEPEIWENLSHPWQACLELAWEAYCDNCVPIGAVITDSHGRILSRARNRINGDKNHTEQIVGDTLAHAELNALLALDNINQETRYRSTLYTSLEPCPLCMGALYMSGVRTVRFAARDPYAGSTNLLGTTWYLSAKPVKAIGPEDPVIEAVLMAIHVEWDMRRRGGVAAMTENLVIQRWGAVVPSAVRFGTQLYSSNHLVELGEERRPAAEVFEHLIMKFNESFSV